MAKRFIVSKEDISINNDLVVVVGEEVKHIQVLRYNVDDEIHINQYICKIISISKKEIVCKYIKDAEEKGIPKNNIILYQAVLKSDKMDYVIQKSVELGVKKVIPIITKNVVVKLEQKDKLKKKERWNKISKEASKQCGRTDEVCVDDVISFNSLIENIESLDAVFFAYEEEINSLRKSIEKIKEVNKRNLTIGVIVGAEGGFTKEEADRLSALNIVYPVSLGDRILRAETASLNLLSIMTYELEM